MLIDQQTMDDRMKEAQAIDNALRALQPGVKKPSSFNKQEADADVAKNYHIAASDRQGLDKILEYEYHIWVAYDLKKRRYSENFKRRYEVFCGGWLHFWDKNISIESEERCLYIKWDGNYVVLYISNETDPRRCNCISINHRCGCICPPSDPPKAPPPPPPGEV